MSSRKTYGDGTPRRTSHSARGFQHPPIWVLARSYEEVQRYCIRFKRPIRNYKFIDGPHRIRQEIPEGQRFRLVRTGTWFLIDKDTLEEIEFELKIREEWQE